MSDYADLALDFQQLESCSPDSQAKLLRTLLKEQITLNRELDEKNLSLKNSNVILENQCEELSAKLGLKSKEVGGFRDDPEVFDKNGFSLEIDMLKAKVSSSILKSIVAPLENEVEHLKKRLAEAESLLEICSFKHKPVKLLPEAQEEELSNSDSSTQNDISNTFSSIESQSETLEIKKKLEK
ncbi:hypothetical protein RF11_13129 [Thelohanellus kitauei]|uniref:Uncharacterized protein n=1 Tax=Thelohanellus kitauei TaxID=669202 RepID=A0A0C2NGY6_THEKT|nr:hypothetical protein RF11_13129 [Thelohanellus kitauei]